MLGTSAGLTVSIWQHLPSNVSEPMAVFLSMINFTFSEQQNASMLEVGLSHPLEAVMLHSSGSVLEAGSSLSSAPGFWPVPELGPSHKPAPMEGSSHLMPTFSQMMV